MKQKQAFMWATLVHFGTNMWYDVCDKGHEAFTELWEIPGSAEMRLDKNIWIKYMDYLKQSGINTLIIDIGDGVIYDSHPEIAIKGSWTKADFLSELERLKNMGFNLIPKLNFSSCHDIWMKEYSRMVSTPLYYKVVEDLIDEVCELFEPRFIHLGLDEETYEHQSKYDYAVVRQNDLWWNDLYFYVRCAEKNGVRPMMWSDYARNHPEEFVEKCPKSMVQCVWYYFNQYGDDIAEMYRIRIMPIDVLEKAGFDQLPTGSIEYDFDCMPKLVDYCTDHISKEHLLGFMQTTWAPIMDHWKYMLDKGNAATMDGIKVYEEKLKK